MHKFLQADLLFSQPMEALTTQESFINPVYFIVAPDVLDEFFDTAKAMHQILEQKLYKARYKNADGYLYERWNIARRTGYNFAIAGKVIIELEKSIARDKMPTTVGLLLMIDKLSRKHHLQYEDVWERALKFFGKRQDVVAVQMKNALDAHQIEEEEEERVDSAVVVDSSKELPSLLPSPSPSSVHDDDAIEEEQVAPSRRLRKRTRSRIEDEDDDEDDDDEVDTNARNTNSDPNLKEMIHRFISGTKTIYVKDSNKDAVIDDLRSVGTKSVLSIIQDVDGTTRIHIIENP